ncbi:hypothetical protein G9A89_020429 [Geosiphon pyriformis]|nr:hypothetical protein G9A89_020429 [Geosiphon pyriformis]
MTIRNGKLQQNSIATHVQGKWDNKSCLTCETTLPNEKIWNDILEQERTYDKTSLRCLEGYPYDEHKIWRMASAKVEGTTPTFLPTLPKPNTHPKRTEAVSKTDKHSTLSTLLNSLSCVSESESTFDPNLNSDNDNNNNNNSSSFIQNGNQNNNNSNLNSNFKQYIVLPNLTKKQKLKWFSNNNEGIMPEHVHDTNARFDLRYPGKDAIKLEPYSCICINLIIALEISATTIIQLALRSSLEKKEINIKRGIIDTEYVRNIIVMLQNNSEKAYIIKPNEKIAQIHSKQTSTTFKKRDQKPLQNNFKVATTPDATTLEYYQSIYTHCKQRFNIPDGIKVVKKSVYQYIKNHINNYFFGNYNILEVRSNLYNNLAHYSQLKTEDLNSETLATYFQELNFNIIKYCKETYPVQFQYFIDFESETETSNKGKQKLKQYSKTTPNTPILSKTTAKHLQTPEQGTKPLQTSSNLLDFLSENQSEHSETAANEENDSEITKKESIDNIETSPQEWLDQVTKAGDANKWNAARMLRTIPYFFKGTAGEWFENLATLFNDWDTFKAAFLEQFTDNNTSITLRNRFCNIKQELFKSNKLIKKVHPHAPEDLNSVIQHAKRYKMAIEEANHTKLMNLAIGETSSAAEEKIDQFAKKVENYFTNQQQQQPQRYQPLQRRNQNNFTSLSNNQSQSCHYYQQNKSNQCYPPLQQSYYQPPSLAYYLPRLQYQSNYYQSVPQPIQQQYQQPPTQHYQPRPTHYYTQPSYLTIPKEQDFYHTALSEARIAENANLSDIFPFEFEANKSPFLLSNAATNKQKAITAMYTEAEVEEKTIHLILDSRSTRSIITYQLIQQLKRNVDRPAQTVIVTADGIKKTPVGEIDNFQFTLDGIIIPIKVLIMDAPQYQALVRNDWLQKANANLNWETQEQHTQVPATCGTFNKHSEKAPAFEFEPEEEKPIIKTFMALGSTFN